MKKLAAKLWAVLMLMLVSMQTMATDTFTSNRTDFRDESIYFMMTTRFYDGDTGNNVLCWDNQSEQIKTKDPCWRGDFQGVIDKLDYIKALGFTAIWITPVVQNASGYDYHLKICRRHNFETAEITGYTCQGNTGRRVILNNYLLPERLCDNYVKNRHHRRRTHWQGAS